MKAFGSALCTTGVVISIIAAVFLFLSFQEGISAMKAPVDLYGDETNVSEIGYFDMVEANVWAVFDCFASEVTKENGVKKDEDYFYIIPAYEGEEMVYIGVKVNDNTYKTYEEIRDITYDYLMGYSGDFGTVTVKTTGCLKKMESKVKKYYYEWFESNEWFSSQEEMNKYAIPMYIDSIANPALTKNMAIISIAALAVGLIILILGIVRTKKENKQARDQAYVVIGGVNYPKSAFSHVNQCINSQERIFAAQELHEITGVSLDEAGEIINNWHKYYY